MASFEEKPIVFADTVQAWERFLESGPDGGGVRLRLRKRTSTMPGILWAEAVEVALCFGWIDGQGKSLDADYTLQAFTPRRARSMWSQINRDHAERLIGLGRVRPSGLAEIERAKADGRWDAAYRQKGAEVPAGLRIALDAAPSAAANFDALRKQDRYAIIFRLNNLKLQKNRDVAIAEYVAKLSGLEPAL